jgi:FkbM family methyltransferase
MSPPRDSRSLPERVRSSIAYARRLARGVDLGPVRLPAFLVARQLAPLRRVPFRFAWRGHRFLARPADEAAIQEVLLEQEYAAAARLVAAAPDRPVVIDAGANIGLFAMVMLAARPDARVHSLEPGAATFALLEANTRANPAFAWHAHRLAVWRTAGPVAFGAMDASTSSRIDELAPGGRVEMVEAVTLGGFAAQHAPGPIFLMKLDVEGAEEAVLASSEAVLDRVQHLLLEIHPPRADEARVMAILSAHFPHVARLPGRRSAKPLVLASRVPIQDLAQ